MERNKLMEVHGIVEQMRRNSEAWHMASPVEKMELEQKNRGLGQRLREGYGIPTVYCDGDGVWYVGLVGAARLYDLY